MSVDRPTDEPTTEGSMRVWWIPQIPMAPFIVDIDTAEQGNWLIGVLSDYDQFQFENNVKPDYSNMGGIEVFEDGEWLSLDEDDDPA